MTDEVQVRALRVEPDSPLDPGQRRAVFPARDEHGGDGVTILCGEPGLLGEHDVGRRLFRVR